MKDNPIVTKTFAFALRIVKLSRYLMDTHKEFTMSRELLGTGTKIGRDVRSALAAESRESFIMNMARGLQKADETEYWLALVHFAGMLDDKAYASIESDRKEIAGMLNKIVKTSKENA